MTAKTEIWKLESALRKARSAGRTGLIPYFPVGFPELDSALTLIQAAENAGADAIELGVPFSDPLADGPTVQRAASIALANGVTLETCLSAVRSAREHGISVPLILMGYYNPLHRFGLERFAEHAADSGVDGCIVPDLPPEEAAPLRAALDRRGVALVPMIAPTSSDERIALATRASHGFVYCVSVAGVTGARPNLPAELPTFVERVRNLTDLPIAIGFGISTPAHFAEVGTYADVAVVGSAVVDRIAGHSTAEAAHRLRAFLEELRGAVKSR